MCRPGAGFAAGVLVAVGLGGPGPAPAQNLLANPEFDSGIANWSAQANGVIAWDGMVDIDGDPNSGALKLTKLAGSTVAGVAAADCVAVTPGIAYTFGGNFLVPAGQGGTARVLVTLFLYDGGGCTGSPLASPGSTNFAVVGSWFEKRITSVLPAEAVSAELHATAFHGESSEFIVLADRFHVMPGPIFADDFESADFSAWSLAVGTFGVFLFDGGGAPGALGGRTGADERCATARSSYPNLPLGTARALISVSASDEIRDLPSNFGLPISRPVVGPFGARVAETWNDLLDGAIDMSLQAAGVLTTTAYWYSGSSADGSLHANNCSGWTDGLTLFGGRYGRNDQTDSDWLSTGDATCGLAQYHVLCVVW